MINSEDSAAAVLNSAQLFHIGVVADDVEAATAEMSRTLGLTFKSEGTQEMELWIRGEKRRVEMRIYQSLQGPPHFEVLGSVPDSPWETASAGVHHLCFWSEESAAACAVLDATPGYRRELGLPGSEGGYFRTPNGMLIEIIGRRIRDQMAAWISDPTASGPALKL